MDHYQIGDNQIFSVTNPHVICTLLQYFTQIELNCIVATILGDNQIVSVRNSTVNLYPTQTLLITPFGLHSGFQLGLDVWKR